MDLQEIWHQFIEGLQKTSLLEYIAVFAGIASVWFSRKENILVYPVGLINTIIYIWLSFKGDLIGEASVNFYYTVMSIYGWVLWTKKDKEKHPVVHISFSDRKWWLYQLAFFVAFYITIFLLLTYLKRFCARCHSLGRCFCICYCFYRHVADDEEKVESWYWWVATNIASMPLYFVKHYVFTSVYYLILLFMAVWGLFEWSSKAKKQQAF